MTYPEEEAALASALWRTEGGGSVSTTQLWGLHPDAAQHPGFDGWAVQRPEPQLKLKTAAKFRIFGNYRCAQPWYGCRLA